jgi:hypothetical protein
VVATRAVEVGFGPRAKGPGFAANGAHAPPLPNFQTGMPRFCALSARLP